MKTSLLSHFSHTGAQRRLALGIGLTPMLGKNCLTLHKTS